MQESYPIEDYTLDLGKYIDTFFRQWRLIAIATFLCAFTAGLVSVLQPKTYEASVLIASTRSFSTVSFGSAIEIVSEGELEGLKLVDPQSRLNSYVQMVKNPLIAEKILTQFGDHFDEDTRVAGILEMVEGSVAEKSDAVEIVVQADDPELAADIANAWGDAYEEQLNSLYANSSQSVATLENIQDQMMFARIDYEQSQENLEEYIRDNRADEIERRIELLSVYIEQASQYTQNELSDIYAELRQVSLLLGDAKLMDEQLIVGGEQVVSSNTLPLMLLKVQAFSFPNSSLFPPQNQIHLEYQVTPFTASLSQMKQDINGLVEVLGDRKIDLQNNIDNMISVISSGERADNMGSISGVDGKIYSEVLAIQNLEEQKRELQAQLAEERNQEQELMRARDLAWTTYTNLATKEEELKVTVNTQGVAVVIAVPAVAPTSDMSKDSVNVALAALVGLMLGVGAAFFIEFWWSYKGFEPQPISVTSVLREGLGSRK